MAVVETSADHAAPSAASPEPYRPEGDAGEREMRDLEDLLSKLNPMAEEFVPPSLAAPPAHAAAYGYYPNGGGFAPVASPGHGGVVGFPAADGLGGRGRKKIGAGYGGHGHGGNRRMNSRTSMAQRDEVIRPSPTLSFSSVVAVLLNSRRNHKLSAMRQGGGGTDGISPGNVPVCYYGPGGRVPASLERRVRAAEVLLRCAACGLAVLAAALLGADRQTRFFFSIEKVARYTDMQSLVFLVIANGMAACYSLIQGARCLASIVRGGVLLSRPLAWAIFSCDQVMAYITISAVAVAMEAALIGKYGQPEFQWMKTCHLYKRFCAQAGGGIACAIAASANMVGIALLSAFNLFRLYGNGKGRK